MFDTVRERNPHQTPSRQVEMQGDLYLARSQRRRIQAAPLPADLQAALTDQNMYTRLGAVSELQARLQSDNLPAAAGAYAALAGLANDIRYVAEPATAAAAGAAIQPDPDRVSLGRVEPGAAVPAQRVRLPGPPIARACTLRPSHDWIRCALTVDGFDVSADTARTGRFEGTVEVKGPTGRATVTVELVVAGHAAGPASGPEARRPPKWRPPLLPSWTRKPARNLNRSHPPQQPPRRNRSSRLRHPPPPDPSRSRPTPPESLAPSRNSPSATGSAGGGTSRTGRLPGWAELSS